MNRTILYYPTINIPNENWLRQALLYWDNVSSIIPKDYDNNLLYDLSPELEYLIDVNQFKPVDPQDLIFKQDNWDILNEFQAEFQEIVSSVDFTRFINRNAQYKGGTMDYKIHRDKIDRNSKVHNDKISSELLDALEEKGLAKRSNDYEWIDFEPNTALLYMSLLAKYLADIDADYMTIGTDYAVYEQFNFKRINGNDGFPVVSLDLNRVLPTPKENVPLEKIVDFKRHRADNLSHFKKMLSDFQSNVAGCESNSELKETAINFTESLTNGVRDLEAVLKDAKVECGLKSLKSLIGIKTPAWVAGAATAAPILGITNPANIITAGLAGIGAIELAVNYVDTRNKQRVKLRESAFAYIYYAYRSNIISRPW